MSRSRVQKPTARKYEFESLEPRRLLAGNVKAAVRADGLLTITGDNSSNAVQVKQLSGDTWRVEGLATKINGKTSSFTAKYVDAIFVDARGGHDFVKVHSGKVPYVLNILTGKGNDVVQLMNVSAYGIGVVTESGADSVLASNVKAYDVLRGLYIETGSSSDAVSLDRVTAGSVGIDTGSGNDAVAASRVNVNSSDPDFSAFAVGAGSGTDSVTLSDINSREHIFVDLGDGKYDNLTIVKSKTKQATFHGGNDSGDVLVRALNSFKKQSVSGFKVVV